MWWTIHALQGVSRATGGSSCERRSYAYARKGRSLPGQSCLSALCKVRTSRRLSCNTGMTAVGVKAVQGVRRMRHMLIERVDLVLAGCFALS